MNTSTSNPEEPTDASPAHDRTEDPAMIRLRLLGLFLIVVAVGHLALMFSPWREWALNHSLASYFAAADRRAGNSIDGPIDPLMAYVSDGVVIFAGLWIALLVPALLNRHMPTMVAGIQARAAELEAGQAR